MYGTIIVIRLLLDKNRIVLYIIRSTLYSTTTTSTRIQGIAQDVQRKRALIAFSHIYLFFIWKKCTYSFLDILYIPTR